MHNFNSNEPKKRKKNANMFDVIKTEVEKNTWYLFSSFTAHRKPCTAFKQKSFRNVYFIHSMYYIIHTLHISIMYVVFIHPSIRASSIQHPTASKMYICILWHGSMAEVNFELEIWFEMLFQKFEFSCFAVQVRFDRSSIRISISTTCPELGMIFIETISVGNVCSNY